MHFISTSYLLSDVVVSSLVSSSGFGAADGQVLVTHAIPGLSSPMAGDGPIPSSPGPIPAFSIQMLLWFRVLGL